MTTEITQDNGADWGTRLQWELRTRFARTLRNASPDAIFRAAAGVLRPELVDRLMATADRFQAADGKSICYLSMEFLIGRSLSNNLHNLGLYAEMDSALAALGLRLADVLESEPDAALGNGGLGRLAACYLDSLASLHMPAYGYGINYEYGLFRQEIEDGYQKEKPDFWASERSPWLIEHLDDAFLIPLYGRIDHSTDRSGNYNPMWLDWHLLVGIPHDMPIVSQDGKTVNVLRLFSARASKEFDIAIFNSGDYLKAVEQKMNSETVSKVLYPSDAVAAGKELRLIQEYFLVACAVRDVFRRFLANHSDPRELPSKVAVQLNDTHPALTVAELMRTLLDEHDLDWDSAWGITQKVCGYTNHTLMPEALEKWPVELFERVVPRHLQIVYEINHRFLKEVAARWPGDHGRLRRMSLIEEGPERMVRMANLSIVGSHAVNGVAKLHSELVITELVPDFHEFFPGRFSNKTNGVTPRRWLSYANPGLAEWITKRIGDGWRRDLTELRALEAFAADAVSQEEFAAVKQANKRRLARTIEEKTGIRVDPSAMFDVQVKRIHEYKRQLLNVLGAVDEYLRIVEDGWTPPAPRVHIFAGKAAPGYYMAKLIVKLINNVARVINRDAAAAASGLKMVFLPDYKVSLAEIIIPGADLSEQISTAGTEASGTSNMKFALNGALTMGTLDGANVEMREEVGAENIFIFGHTTSEVRALRAAGYRAWNWYARNPRIGRVMNAIEGNRFSAREAGIFEPICRSLIDHDQYLHFADFASYVERQEEASRLFADKAAWNRKAILNVARMGKFSSDRSIQEYADDIWDVRPVPPE